MAVESRTKISNALRLMDERFLQPLQECLNEEIGPSGYFESSHYAEDNEIPCGPALLRAHTRGSPLGRGPPAKVRSCGRDE